MVANNIHDFRSTALLQRIGTEGYHLVVTNNIIDRFFVIGKTMPVFFLQPESIAG